MIAYSNQNNAGLGGETGGNMFGKSQSILYTKKYHITSYHPINKSMDYSLHSFIMENLKFRLFFDYYEKLNAVTLMLREKNHALVQLVRMFHPIQQVFMSSSINNHVS